VNDRHVGLVLLMMCLASGASAQIMECTSASGKKEFAQACPPGTVKQKELAGSSATRPVSDTSADSAGSQRTASQLEIEFQQRRIAREQNEEKQEQARQANKNKCDALKQRLDMYENARGIKRKDPATGQWVVVEDTQRPVIIAQIRNEMKQCQ